MRVPNKNEIARHVGAGRPNKYCFFNIPPGGVMTVPVPSGEDARYAAIKVSTALSNWKRRNGERWPSCVRNDGKTVFVYRFEDHMKII